MGAKVEPVKQAAQSRKMQSKGGRQRGRMACTRACLIMASSALCLFAPCSCWSPASFALAFPQELHTPSSLCSASSLAKHVCNTQQRTALSSSSSSSNPNNIGVGVDTNHAKKSQAFDLAKEDVLAPCIILVRPFLDQNIGTTARAMLNFGLWDLRLVDPQCNHLSEAAFARASGAENILNGATVFPSVSEAVEDLHRVYATTARIRAFVTKVVSAAAAAEDAVEIAAREGAQAGFLFGPERSGLTNDDLGLVDRVVQIPTLSMFSSLNLAQAVNVLSYESWKAREKAREGGSEEGGGSDSGAGRGVLTQLEVKGGRATKKDLDAYMRRLETALTDADFQPQAEKRDTIFRQLRSIYSRADLTSSEVQLLQGVLTSLLKP